MSACWSAADLFWSSARGTESRPICDFRSKPRNHSCRSCQATSNFPVPVGVAGDALALGAGASAGSGAEAGAGSGVVGRAAACAGRGGTSSAREPRSMPTSAPATSDGSAKATAALRDMRLVMFHQVLEHGLVENVDAGFSLVNQVQGALKGGARVRVRRVGPGFVQQDLGL